MEEDSQEEEEEEEEGEMMDGRTNKTGHKPQEMMKEDKVENNGRKKKK